MPLEALHQKANEPYFMNAMVFYDIPWNSLKRLGPKPALSASFLPQRLQGHAERVSTVALPEPGSPGAHASVPCCPLCLMLSPAQAEVFQALFWSQKGQGDHASGHSHGRPPEILVPNPPGWSWEGNPGN